MARPRRLIRLVLAAPAALALLSCTTARVAQRSLVDPGRASTLDQRAPYLKAHMRNGDVYILARWRVDTVARLVEGEGDHQDPNRATLVSGAQRVPLDSVALFETNVLHQSSAVAALAVVTGASAALTVYCLANTKACFGSCPTFYVGDGSTRQPDAEGFSSSIAPALEATDVDALYRAHPRGRELSLVMRNEALETHVLRWVQVLAVPRPAGGRAFYDAARNEFRPASHILAPARCTAPEGDCLTTLRDFDGVERYSSADSTDLATPETLELEFDRAGADSLGLVIASRQTLLSTYVLYQALAYLGHNAGSWLASLDRPRQSTRDDPGTMGRLLGGIDVLVQNASGEWVSAGGDREAGPLATDVHLVPLPRLGPGRVHVRLRMTRGMWRLDYVALATLGAAVTPLRLAPARVYRDTARDDAARRLLTDSTAQLVTLPGDAYRLDFDLPAPAEQYELFLESRGYYLEWMRQEWLAETSASRAARLLLDPAGSLRALAPEYKRHESEMESAFWRSRYVRPSR